MNREVPLAPFLSDPWRQRVTVATDFLFSRKIKESYCILKNNKLTLSIK